VEDGKEGRPMADKARDIMSTRIVFIDSKGTLADAARLMRENNIGDVLIIQDDQVRGILTDRDIVVRGIAAGHEPTATPAMDIASENVASVSPDDEVETVKETMARHAVRRVPVIDKSKVVGIVSIGDLVKKEAPESTLGKVSEAPPNS